MSEHLEQAALMRMAKLNEKRNPDLKLLFAIPNGARVTLSTARKLKREGMKSGVPDLFLPIPRGDYAGLWIELKTKRGTASKEQKQWLAALRAQGYRAEICKGWEAAWSLINEYLKPIPY